MCVNAYSLLCALSHLSTLSRHFSSLPCAPFPLALMLFIIRAVHTISRRISRVFPFIVYSILHLSHEWILWELIGESIRFFFFIISRFRFFHVWNKVIIGIYTFEISFILICGSLLLWKRIYSYCGFEFRVNDINLIRQKNINVSIY